MPYKFFKLSVKNNIAHLVMARPEKRNAMDPHFWSELPAIVRDIDDNARARVIVLSAEGPIFSAGIDISMFASGDETDKNNPVFGARTYDEVKSVQASLNALEDCRIPVLVAVQGGCYGGGVDLITACDMRYGVRESFITIYEIEVALTADAGTFPRILNHMAEGVVRELAYTGRKMMADECMSRGLFNNVYENQDDMMTAVMEIAATIASKSPLAVYGCKRAITYSRDHSTADALDNIAVWNMSMMIPSEMAEAMHAKKDNRAASHVGLPKRHK